MKKSPAQAVQAPGLFNRIFGAGGRAARSWPARYLALAVLLVAGATFGGVFAVANAQDADGAISGLTLTSDSPGTLAVSWDAPDTSPSDYRVNWARADESYPAWTSDEGNRHPEGTSVELTGLDQDVEYKVRVRARYHKGEYADNPWSGPWADARLTVAGDPEEEPTPTPTPTPTPEPSPTPVPRGAISGLALLSDEPGSLSIAWNAPDLAPTDYRVVWAPVGDGFPSWKDENTAGKGNSYPAGDATSLTLSGLPQGAETKVMVRARYHDGDHAGSPWSGPWSTQAAHRVRGAVPAAPSAVGLSVVEEDGGTLVRLIWLAPEHDALTGYRIWRGPDADSLSVLVEDTGSTATTYDDATVAAGESYVYAVAALSPDGTGARAVSPEVVLPDPETSEPLVALQQSSSEPTGEDFPGADDLAHTTTGIVTPGTTSSGELTSGVDTLARQAGDYWWLDVKPGRSYRVEVSFGGSTSLDTGGSAWPHFIEDGDTRPSSCCDPDHNRDDGLTFVHVDPPKRGVQGIVRPDRRYMLFVASYDKLPGDDSATYTGAYTITLTDITGVEKVVSNLDPQSGTISNLVSPDRQYAVAFTTGSSTRADTGSTG